MREHFSKHSPTLLLMIVNIPSHLGVLVRKDVVAEKHRWSKREGDTNRKTASCERVQKTGMQAVCPGGQRLCMCRERRYDIGVLQELVFEPITEGGNTRNESSQYIQFYGLENQYIYIIKKGDKVR